MYTPTLQACVMLRIMSDSLVSNHVLDTSEPYIYDH